MIPTGEVNGGNLDTLFVSLAILGILLIVGTILRLYVPFFKKFYFPASLIAGFIGLLLGPSILKIIPQNVISCWSSLSGKLIVLVFAPMLMGKRKTSAKKYARKTFNSICFGYVGCFMQYAIPLLLTVLLFTPLFDTNALFGTTFEQGWCGGHGTASGMLAVFEELGWAEGQSIAVTNATIGLLCGIFGGIVLINIAARKGWTQHLNSDGQALGIKNTETELYNTEELKKEDTKLAISGKVIDNLAFHAAILGVAVFVGWIVTYLLKTYLNFSVSWFVTAMFAGGLVQLVLNKTKWGDAVDTKVYSRIQGISLDFLVVGAIASLNLKAIASNIVPIAVTSVLLLVFMVVYSLYYARGIFGNDWFENAMMTYGMYTGVAATGMLLLKVCDPESKSDALSLYAARAPFSSWAIGGGVITSMMPVWVAQFGVLPVALVSLGLAIVVGILPILLRTWYKKGKEE
ncbi:MAG: sodium/glutamate symporter [Acutalibacteraceae bacterium]|nr:sodium/glutamate symporter [Acutalibacteraceae bacterium]